MAGSEVYRVEIPIIVDDQSEAPLTKARERVSKFEQAAQKTNQRIQRMAMTDYRLRLSVLDRAMPVIDKVGRTLKTMTTRAWTFTVGVKDKVTGFLGRIGRMLTTPLGMIGMGGLTLGPMALIGSAIKTAGEFEQAMANVQSVAGASREEMARLREAAAKAGRETVFKASEAADALYYLALAGYNVDQQIGALSGTLALAAATQSDLAFTSETVASTISAFGLEAEEAQRVANVFAATISGSQASMEKLAQSMRYAGPAAAGFGRSLEETAATLALFYNMGLTGEMAGTRFRTALSALAHPTGDAKKALAELGIKASQVNPAMHSLADIIDLLKDKGVDTAMAMRIFGQETGPAMASLIALGGNALRDMERQLTGTNKALEMQEIQLDTLTGAQKELQSVWESVNITLGTQSIPGLRRLVEWLKETIGNSEELAKKIGERVNRAMEWLADILESPEFKEATFIEKVRMLFEAGLDGVNTWLEGPGGEMISDTIERMGTLLATGIEELTPVIVPPAVNLGLEIGKGIVRGLWEAIQASPWAAVLIGAYTGAKVGSVIPGVGTAAGAAAGAGIGLATWGLPKGFESLGKHIPGSGHYTKERLAEYEQAEQMLKERRATTPAGEPLYSGTSLAPMPKRAIGGIFSRPHTALVAEAGPEAIIPLSARMRARAMDLWLETGKRLGVRPYAEGGLVGTIAVGREAGQKVAATKHAIGGILTRPHLGLVAETVPEAIIPLSYKMRNRALDLWQKVGTMLGVMPELPKLTGPVVITGDKDISENIQYVTHVSEIGKRFANVVEMKQYRNLERLKNDIHDNIQQTTEAIETTRRLTNVIDIEQYRNLKTRNNTINENEAQFVTTENKIQTVKAYETGGILTHPHLGLVAEAGPEAIIPLSSSRRQRAIELWKQTGELLGVRAYTEGGFAGDIDTDKIEMVKKVAVGALQMADVGDNLVTLTQAVNMSKALRPMDRAGRALGTEMNKAGRGALSGLIAGPLDAAGGGAIGTLVGGIDGTVGGEKFTGWLYDKFTKHAAGGIMTYPHLGLVAEAGPEAIIPLSVSMKDRALDSWHKTGMILGALPELPQLTELTIISPISASKMAFKPATNTSETARRFTDVIDIEQLRKLRARNNTITENQMQFITAAKWNKAGIILGDLPKLPELVDQAAIYSVTDAIPGLPQLTGDAHYRTDITIPRLQTLINKARVTPEIKALPRIPQLAGSAVITPTLGDLLKLPEVSARSVISPILSATPELPKLAGDILYRTNVVMPKLQPISSKAIDNLKLEALSQAPPLTEKADVVPMLGTLPKLPKLAGQVAMTANTILSKLPALRGKAAVDLETGDFNRLPEMQGKALYQIVARIGSEVATPLISSPHTQRYMDNIIDFALNQNKAISKNIRQTTNISETRKNFADIVDIKQYENLKRTRNNISDNIRRTTEMTNTVEKLAHVIDIEQYRNLKKTRNNTINENQTQFISAANKIQTVKAYATGGILTKPHIGLVAEAGPEVIIPLSTRMRARALELYEKTGRMLGVRPYAEGGFAGALTQNREQKIPVSLTPSLAVPGSATINLNFDLAGLVNQVVIESREDIDGAVNRITDAIANNLRSVFQNMTK